MRFVHQKPRKTYLQGLFVKAIRNIGYSQAASRYRNILWLHLVLHRPDNKSAWKKVNDLEIPPPAGLLLFFFFFFLISLRTQGEPGPPPLDFFFVNI